MTRSNNGTIYSKGTDFIDTKANHSLVSVDSGCWAIWPCCTLSTLSHLSLRCPTMTRHEWG